MRCFGLADFFQLEETGNEIAFGLIGRFWKLDYGLVRIGDTNEFLNFAAPATASSSWSGPCCLRPVAATDC